MADLAGRINGTTSNADIRARIEWEETVDTVQNTGTVTATLYLKKTSTYANRTYSHGSDFDLKINGDTKHIEDKYIELYSDAGWVKCVQHTVENIPHDADGAKSIFIKATGRMAGTSVTSIACNATVALLHIPRASTFTASSTVEVNGTNAVQVNIARMSAAYTHRVDIYVGSSYDAATYRARFTGVATAKSYAIPASWRLAMPASMSGTARVTVATFAGATQIGDAATSAFTIRVPMGIRPTITEGTNVSFSPAQPSALSGFSHYVQGYSGVKATFGTTASAFQSEVAIAQTYIRLGSVETTGNPAATGTLSVNGNVEVKVGVKDARGQTATYAKTIAVQAYSPPSVTGVEVYRATSGGAASDAGTYARVRATALYSGCAGDNHLTYFRARVRPATSSSWWSWANLTSGAAAVIGGGSLSATQSYDVQIQIQDAAGNAAYSTARIPTADVAFHIRDGGRGIGLGKFAEADNRVDSAWPIKAPDLLVDTHKIKTYSKVIDLGLTEGTATLNDCLAAMPNHSILSCAAGELASGETPSVFGTVVIRRTSNSARSFALFLGKAATDLTYRKYLNTPGDAFLDPWYPVYDGSPQGKEAMRKSWPLLIGKDPSFSDTPVNWKAEGFGWAWMTSDGASSVANKPSAYGILLNIPSMTNKYDVHQLYLCQNHGSVYHRGGNSTSAWGGEWKKLFDSSHVIGIENGGTGAQSGADALSNFGMRRGSFWTNGVNGNGYKDFSVSFSPALPSTPIVTTSILCASSANSNYGFLQVATHSISKTGFTARVFNAHSNALSPGIMWTAIIS